MGEGEAVDPDVNKPQVKNVSGDSRLILGDHYQQNLYERLFYCWCSWSCHKSWGKALKKIVLLATFWHSPPTELQVDRSWVIVVTREQIKHIFSHRTSLLSPSTCFCRWLHYATWQVIVYFLRIRQPVTQETSTNSKIYIFPSSNVSLSRHPPSLYLLLPKDINTTLSWTAANVQKNKTKQ